MGKHDASAINDICRISAGTEVKGSFVTKSDIRIDGSFEGDLVTGGKLVLGEKASFKGSIICKSADIWGVVEGELTVKESVGFKSMASFTGNLKAGRISIESGARFNGSCAIAD